MHHLDPESRRMAAQTQIPLISRQLNSNTAEVSGKHSRIETSKSPTNTNTVLFDRSTKNKIRKTFHTVIDKQPIADDKSQKSYTDNLQRAQSEISLLRQELKIKNTELLKLKNQRIFQDKCKTPIELKDYISPKKSVSRRSKLRSRAKTGEGRATGINEQLERSNTQSDEYYETTKISPTSSFTNSVYSKGITQIKSSQS